MCRFVGVAHDHALAAALGDLGRLDAVEAVAVGGAVPSPIAVVVAVASTAASVVARLMSVKCV